MRIVVRLERDDGSVLLKMEGNALLPLEWRADPHGTVIAESGERYYGFIVVPRIGEPPK